MIKVLFLINTLCGGGAERVLIETVNSLDHSKYQVTVQTIIDDGIYRNNLSPYVQYKSIVSVKNKLICNLLTCFLLKFCGSGFIYHFFVKDDYDYEIAFLEGFPTKVISKSTNSRSKKYAWVHTDLNAFPDSYRAYGSQECERFAYQRFDRIFCVSEDVKRAFQNKYPQESGRLRVVYNILDDRAIVEASNEEVRLPVRIRPILITVGRLVKAKGYDRLLRVHHRLIKEGLEHSLLILGDGEERNKLNSYIAENDLTNSAFLLGFQTNPHKYMRRANLFVCSSFAEGYSTVVSESVLCDTPVLSTEVAGAHEPLFLPRCSVIIDNSEEALFNALHFYLSHPEELEALSHDLEQRKTMLRKDFLLSAFEKEVFGEEK